MNINNIDTYLKDIQGTRLFAEDRVGLSEVLRRKSVKSGNSIVRSTGRSDSMKMRDYDVLVDMADVLTRGGISPNEGSFHLEDLLREYRSVSSLDVCSNTTIASCRFGRYQDRAVNLIKMFDSSLSAIYSKHLSRNHGGMLLLHYDTSDISTFVENYYGSIGILILLGCIPLCNDKVRFHGSSERLNKDTQTAFEFLFDLYYATCVVESEGLNILRSIYDKKNKVVKTSRWCRLSLVFWFTRILTWYVIKKVPEALDEFVRPLCERRFLLPSSVSEHWCNEGDDPMVFYKLERNRSKVLSCSYFLFKCKAEVKDGVPRILNDRFELTFYRNGKACISGVEYGYYFLTKEDDCEKYEGLYNYSYDGETLSFDLVADPRFQIKNLRLSLLDIDKKPDWYRSRLEPFNKQEMSLDNCLLARLLAIFRDPQVVLLGNDQGPLFQIKANHENKLLGLYPTLTIMDSIVVFEFSNGKMFLFIEKNGRFAFDITAHENKVKYGVNDLRT